MVFLTVNLDDNAALGRSYLKEKGFDIDRKKITMDDVKFVGDFSAILDLHKEVKQTFHFEVVGE